MENFKLVHDSIKPPVWSHRLVAKFVWIQFGEWAVRANVASPNGPRESAIEAEDRSPPKFGKSRRT